VSTVTGTVDTRPIVSIFVVHCQYTIPQNRIHNPLI